MRKLFNLLNEIYDDGTNEIQSIIAVTILGELNNDQDLLANCVDYMSADMISPRRSGQQVSRKVQERENETRKSAEVQAQESEEEKEHVLHPDESVIRFL